MSTATETFTDLLAVLLAAGGQATVTPEHVEAARSGAYAVTCWEQDGVTRYRVSAR